jgi:hypothetical protein
VWDCGKWRAVTVPLGSRHGLAALALVVLARRAARMRLRVVVMERQRQSQPIGDVRPQLLRLVDELIALRVAVHASPPGRHGTIAFLAGHFFGRTRLTTEEQLLGYSLGPPPSGVQISVQFSSLAPL